MGHIYSSTSAGVVSSNLVDVVKVDVAWQQSELYISNGGGWAGDPERYEKFGKWMERKEPIQIASLGLFDEVIEFNDGRHRFAWLRDHGVKIMTVHVDPDKVELVKSRFEALAGLISSLGEAGNLLTRNGQFLPVGKCKWTSA